MCVCGKIKLRTHVWLIFGAMRSTQLYPTVRHPKTSIEFYIYVKQQAVKSFILICDLRFKKAIGSIRVLSEDAIVVCSAPV